MTTKGTITHRIQIERGGVMQEWVLRDEPFSDRPNLRAAYERGFHQRTRDFDRGEMTSMGPRSAKVETVGDAYAHGYAAALQQERPA